MKTNNLQKEHLKEPEFPTDNNSPAVLAALRRAGVSVIAGKAIEWSDLTDDQRRAGELLVACGHRIKRRK